MKRFGKIILLCAIGAVALSGCDTVRENLGYTKRAPDEFAVYKRAPLSLPPEYSLRPPEPGAQRPSSESPKTVAERALLRQTRANQAMQPKTGRSYGEQALLRKMGALDVDPNIRSIVNRETSIYAEESESFSDKLIFWQKKDGFGTTVDPEKENRRIKETQALGKPVTEGETPNIERKQKGWLEGIFD